MPFANLLNSLQIHPDGLTQEQAQQQILIFGFNRLETKKTDALTLVVAQFKSPIQLSNKSFSRHL